MAHQAGVSQEAMPAAALRGARGIGWMDVWGDSLGQGTAGLVGWFLGYHHHQVILPPSCPSPDSSPRLLALKHAPCLLNRSQAPPLPGRAAPTSMFVRLSQW